MIAIVDPGRQSLFERLAWRDPITGRALEPIVVARTPSGVPITGALRVAGTATGYPIVDCVVRLTPELAARHAEWLRPFGLAPVQALDGQSFQTGQSVESFGFQWSWNSAMRSAADLKQRVLDRFGFAATDFANKLVLDAGAGAGDQSKYMNELGAAVVSIDLSDAIDVVARKLRLTPQWVGVQADITALPFANDQFDIVYCEGVIQHTRDSSATVRELGRVTRPGGLVLATHYVRLEPATTLKRLKRRVTLGYYEFLRRRLSRMERFRLLLWTGNLAALSYTPLLGAILRRTGTALYYDTMPDFRTTWTNTYDFYGSHEFQRFVEPAEFWSWFEQAPDMRLTLRKIGVVVAEKGSAAASALAGDVRD